MFLNKKRHFNLLSLVLVLLFFVGLTFTQKKQIEVSYPDTTFDYRGVVAMDTDGNNYDELFCDFGNNGIWVFYGGNWTKLNSLNPDWIISFNYSGSDYLLADFGASGLWYWYYSGSWTGTWGKMSNSNASSAFATDDDNDGDQELHVNFSGQGLWRYDMGAATKWTKINTLNSAASSLRMDTLLPGYEEGAHDFDANGLWRFYWGPNWFKLSNSNPADDNGSAELGTGDAAEELIVDFGSSGLWICDGDDHSWHKINSNNVEDLVPVRFEGSSDYEILASFDSISGLYWWNYDGYPGTWVKISNNNPDTDGGFCEPFDPNGKTEVNGDQEVAVDFGVLGLWLFDYTGSVWTRLSSSDPEFMLRCNYFGDERDTSLVVDFGSGGLWLYDGFMQHWTKLNALSPDGMN